MTTHVSEFRDTRLVEIICESIVFATVDFKKHHIIMITYTLSLSPVLPKLLFSGSLQFYCQYVDIQIEYKYTLFSEVQQIQQ